jgi:hypothetical protein
MGLLAGLQPAKIFNFGAIYIWKGGRQKRKKKQKQNTNLNEPHLQKLPQSPLNFAAEAPPQFPVRTVAPVCQMI